MIADPNEAAGDLTAEQLAEIEKKFDEGAATRPVSDLFARFLRVVALVFAAYHYLTAGFALPPDYWHMGWHLSGLFILTYALFPIVRAKPGMDPRTGTFHLGGVPYLDLTLMVLGVAASLYLGLAWRGIAWLGIEEQTFRMGNPNTYDLVFGGILIVLVLDIARRTLGWILPAIIALFMARAPTCGGGGPWPTPCSGPSFRASFSIRASSSKPSCLRCISRKRASLASPCGWCPPSFSTLSCSA